MVDRIASWTSQSASSPCCLAEDGFNADDFRLEACEAAYHLRPAAVDDYSEIVLAQMDAYLPAPRDETFEAAPAPHPDELAVTVETTRTSLWLHSLYHKQGGEGALEIAREHAQLAFDSWRLYADVYPADLAREVLATAAAEGIPAALAILHARNAPAIH